MFEISALLDRYLIGLDDGAINEAWARDLFTEDARVEFPMSRHTGLDGLDIYHRDALGAFASTQHLGSPAIVDRDGDLAVLRANLISTHVHHPGAVGDSLFQVGTLVTGEARRTAEGWRLAVLSFRVLWTRGAPSRAQEPR
ncbi:nuclear transport factor 2 family protein [Streptomyces sp. H27-C3]|uniref:nuclear transport factor 2 family protein n=1 Tax=Streptomyces sp. H27-C3 TaxID=3046305 RepID=UPI0024BAF54A|nr:nuclear transport factor 2 family protein [Streptomyces sp. H27-C3]MDJ0466264.1 nuclear transport factor 2 family protein [Streptomyces sp. H27-C3]